MLTIWPGTDWEIKVRRGNKWDGQNGKILLRLRQKWEIIVWITVTSFEKGKLSLFLEFYLVVIGYPSTKLWKYLIRMKFTLYTGICGHTNFLRACECAANINPVQPVLGALCFFYYWYRCTNRC